MFQAIVHFAGTPPFKALVFARYEAEAMMKLRRRYPTALTVTKLEPHETTKLHGDQSGR